LPAQIAIYSIKPTDFILFFALFRCGELANPKMFLCKFLRQKCFYVSFYAKMFLRQKCFYAKNVFTPKMFLRQKGFYAKNVFTPKMFLR